MAVQCIFYFLIAIQVLPTGGIDFISGSDTFIMILKLVAAYCVYCLYLEMKYNTNVDLYLIIQDC